MSKRIREWLQQKNPTEQRVVIVLFILCVATIYGCGLWLPLNHTVDALQTRCNKLRQDMAWLEKQAQARGVLPQRTPEEPVASLLKKEAEQAGFSVTLTQNSADGVEISANDISQQAFTAWLTRLQSRHGLHVKTLEFHASPAKADAITLSKMTVRTVVNDKR